MEEINDTVFVESVAEALELITLLKQKGFTELYKRTPNGELIPLSLETLIAIVISPLGLKDTQS